MLHGGVVTFPDCQTWKGKATDLKFDPVNGPELYVEALRSFELAGVAPEPPPQPARKATEEKDRLAKKRLAGRWMLKSGFIVERAREKLATRKSE